MVSYAIDEGSIPSPATNKKRGAFRLLLLVGLVITSAKRFQLPSKLETKKWLSGHLLTLRLWFFVYYTPKGMLSKGMVRVISAFLPKALNITSLIKYEKGLGKSSPASLLNEY